MDILDCFGDVVGLTHDTPSDSGLYITDLEAVSTIEGLTVEAGKEVEEILADARRVAILSLNSDLTALMMKYSTVRGPYVGSVGSSRWLYKVKGGAELVLLCRPLKNATMYVSQVGVIFQNAGLKELRFTSNIGDSEVFTINAVANKLTTLAVDLALPLYSEKADLVEYRFSHDEDYCEARLQCGGCKKFKFDYNHPQFTQHGVTSYLAVAGQKSERYYNSSAGVMLSVKINCRIDNVICDEALDYTTDQSAQMYAQAIQHKAGSVVIWSCLRNPKLNRVLMERSEDLREAAKYYERRYRDMIGFINLHRPYDHDCICGKRLSWTGQRR